MLVGRGLTPSQGPTGALLSLLFFSNPHSKWAWRGESPQTNTREGLLCERGALLQ